MAIAESFELEYEILRCEFIIMKQSIPTIGVVAYNSITLQEKQNFSILLLLDRISWSTFDYCIRSTQKTNSCGKGIFNTPHNSNDVCTYFLVKSFLGVVP